MAIVYSRKAPKTLGANSQSKYILINMLLSITKSEALISNLNRGESPRNLKTTEEFT
jgi:hypothetical protein